MNKLPVNFSETGYFSEFISDYVNNADYLKPFFKYTPDLSSFGQAIEDKKKESIDRETLASVLIEQYSNIPDKDLTLKNIESLRTENTFTVTTGHQLGIFTGPLFFLYKIITTMNLAERLRKEYPINNFVPVYWMASEDHDFEEISSINIFGKTLKWEQKQKGTAGKISTESLLTLLEELKQIMGASPNAEKLFSVFEKAYTLPDLASATRYLVHSLFGEYGLVIIDGNDARLKAAFKEVIIDDTFNRSAYGIVNETIARLADNNLKAQVNPREINSFYIQEGLRERIVKSESGYEVLNTELKFTESELKSEVENHPERFSPNVVLRPLYQEKILPNLAYIGGPGELAYWIEYKALFEHYKIYFPVVMLRNCFLIVDEATEQKLKKLNISTVELFNSSEEITRLFLSRIGANISFEDEKNSLIEIFKTVVDKAYRTDPTLKASFEAELQKQLNSFDSLENKLIKSEKQKQEINIGQITKIKQRLFPEGHLQERHENFIPFYIKYGEKFIEEIKDNADPFEKKFIILTN